MLARGSRSRARAACPPSRWQRWAEARRGQGPLAALPLKVDRDLVPGVEVETDLGTWHVVETPGHAPSHVCLHQPERRLLISGDHLLGRVSLYFDVGWSADPVEEFLASLDRIETLDARLALSGHGRPFTDVLGPHRRQPHAGRRTPRRAARAAGRGARCRPSTSRRALFGDAFGAATGAWLFTETLAFLDAPRAPRRGAAHRGRPRALGARLI